MVKTKLKKQAEPLPLFPLLNLSELCREHGLTDVRLTDFSVGWDGRAYLLFAQGPEGRGEEQNSFYTAALLDMDWADGRVADTAVYPLGVLGDSFHFLQPLNEDFLLVGARCSYGESGPEQNALLLRRDGTIRSRFCLGDGILACVTKADGTIITSYFDEGIFGNYGWGAEHNGRYVPSLGECGLAAWTTRGEMLWKNTKYPIDDCYAIHLDDTERLWFYYYVEFRLVRTDFQEDLVLDVPIQGSSAFAVDDTGETFLFQGGYDQQKKLYFLSRQGNRLTNQRKAIPTAPDGRAIEVQWYSLLRRRMLFLETGGMLWGGVLGESKLP